MHTRLHNPFTTIHTEGALLPSDLLQRLQENDRLIPGLTPETYHLSGEKLNEAINRSWNRLQGSWAAFQSARRNLPENDPGTTPTRERWLLPLFQELGYGRLVSSRAIEIEGKSYPISHAWMNVPIHLVGCGVDLEKRSAGVAGASRSSPHSLLQEYLNRSAEAQWGLVSNGLSLRILRDNASLTRQAYLEFDLESMFEGEVYSDFAVLWLVCHQSRFETVGADGVRPDCILETWSKAAQEQGTRALDSLRQGVEGAISALGSGFLRHPANQKLRTDLRSGALSTQVYYRQLLRLVYRLIFLFVAEDRDLLFDPQSSPEARGRYQRYYSVTRLRRLAERSRGGRHPDLYVVIKLVSGLLGDRSSAASGECRMDENHSPLAAHHSLGLSTLGGFLFTAEALPDLESAELENESLLSAIRHLTIMEAGRTRRAVDYKNLGSEELGSIYESLLELHPLVNTDAATFELISVSGSERKTTGSYYTPSSLIQVLLDSALEPVIAEALKRTTTDDRPQTMEGNRPSPVPVLLGSAVHRQEQALLALKVCDPACGSGHFLVAAAHRLARRLATIRTGEGEPAPEALRSALRSVISSCIYGVDINPMSVELCKVSLWMEALEPGKPLSFLDAHIQCGDSLVGVGPGLDISEIPDEAFNPAFCDDKATSSALKKRNKAERGGQMGLDMFVVQSEEDLQAWMAQKAQNVDALPEETLEQVGHKAQSYQEYLNSPQYQRRKQEYDLWTAAFFWKMEEQRGTAGILAPTQEMLDRQRSGGTLPPDLVRRVEELAERLNFLHWELVFPKVFSGSNPGFDCVISNPPWDMVELSEKEYFANAAPEIANASTNTQREKLIAGLEKQNPFLFSQFLEAKRAVYTTRKFIQSSSRFPFSSEGRINLYPIFVELAPSLLGNQGRSGVIVPSGIAMDAYNANLFGWLVKNRLVESFFDFENKLGIFPAVHRMYRFCLLTFSKNDKFNKVIQFCYLCRHVDDIKNKRKAFSLGIDAIEIFSPNTYAPPIFLNQEDAKLAKKIYSKFGVLLNNQTRQNLWQVSIQRMLSLSDPGDYFRKFPELSSIDRRSPFWSRLYGGKVIHQYNHRYTTYAGDDWQEVNEKLLLNPSFVVETEYYAKSDEVQKRLIDKPVNKWMLCYRDITNAMNERTVISAIIPYSGCDTTCRNIYLLGADTYQTSCFLANINSVIFDYFAKQKIIGTHLNAGVFEQLPVLPPSKYNPAAINFIAPRVLELVYTAYDLRPFAEDMGYHGEPFRWDEVRRASLRAELDAYYARLYGLTRDELRYILDPKEVYGEDFPGETFRVLKDKEIRLYGEFRTRRLVLEAWDKLEGVEVSAYSGGRSPAASMQPAVIQVAAAAPAKSAPKKEPKAVEVDPAQPMLSDFGLYKCQVCGKMVMGYEKEKHSAEKHGGKSVEWKKVK
jgi:hypothetical protein